VRSGSLRGRFRVGHLLSVSPMALPVMLGPVPSRRYDDLRITAEPFRPVRLHALGRAPSFGKVALRLQRRETFTPPFEYERIEGVEESDSESVIASVRTITRPPEEDVGKVAVEEHIQQHAPATPEHAVHPPHGPIIWWKPMTWTPRARGLALLNLLVLLAATNWVVVKDVEEHFDAVAFAAIRCEPVTLYRPRFNALVVVEFQAWFVSD
jgi:hypothetical protein